MALLVACLNGPRTTGVPLTPAALAAAAVEAVEAGAGELHLHAKGADGVDSLQPDEVAAALVAVRSALQAAGRGEVRVGVTTGAWAAPDAVERLQAVSRWHVLPDCASVNWHEEGAEELCALLLGRGVAVEAGVWTAEAATAYVSSPLAPRCHRVLVEVIDRPPEQGLALARGMLAQLSGPGLPPALLHGEGFGVWEVLDLAVGLGLDTRIGLEDAELLPGGEPATGNAQLVHAALARGAGEARRAPSGR